MTNNQKGFSRREFISWGVMGGVLVGAYGFLASFIGRFLYPQKRGPRLRDIFITTLGELQPGKPLLWTAPNGQKILIGQSGEELLALSNVCPHLGCKVHWEGANNRFFCPCHSGVFDKNGIATGGPPAAEGKNLKKYDLKIEGEAIYLKWEEVV
jgi:Rieske Fe-S protein